MARAPTMSDIRSRVEQIERDIEKLQAQRAVLLDIINETPEPKAGTRAAKGSVKTTVLKLLEEAKGRGLNATQAVSLAKEQGIDLERGSVSSLLSRLKTDGVVVYDNEVYRLKEYTMPRPVALRTSGDSTFG